MLVLHRWGLLVVSALWGGRAVGLDNDMVSIARTSNGWQESGERGRIPTDLLRVLRVASLLLVAALRGTLVIVIVRRHVVDVVKIRLSECAGFVGFVDCGERIKIRDGRVDLAQVGLTAEYKY